MKLKQIAEKLDELVDILLEAENEAEDKIDSGSDRAIDDWGFIKMLRKG
jgi:hypothetical protein